jgi:hypothetical protein
MMKDAYQVLEQKEADLARVRQEIESLRIVAPLLVDDLNSNDSRQMRLISAEKRGDLSDLENTGTDDPVSSGAISHSAFWNALKHAR